MANARFIRTSTPNQVLASIENVFEFEVVQVITRTASKDVNDDSPDIQAELITLLCDFESELVYAPIPPAGRREPEVSAPIVKVVETLEFRNEFA